jgi:hypothetical protein
MECKALITVQFQCLSKANIHQHGTVKRRTLFLQ